MNIFKLGPNVKMNSSVRIDLSADQWDLYTELFPRTTVEAVATYMNKRFNYGYNQGMSKEQLATFMEEIMNEFSMYGASDMDTRSVLNKLIDTVYP